MSERVRAAGGRRKGERCGRLQGEVATCAPSDGSTPAFAPGYGDGASHNACQGGPRWCDSRVSHASNFHSLGPSMRCSVRGQSNQVLKRTAASSGVGVCVDLAAA
jgi:hypothetical protein